MSPDSRNSGGVHWFLRHSRLWRVVNQAKETLGCGPGLMSTSAGDGDKTQEERGHSDQLV